VAGSEGVWSDARAQRRCRFAAAAGSRFGEVRLALPSEALPVILLGGLPVRLPEGVGAARGERAVQFDDGGRNWRVEMAGDEIVAWRVIDAEGAGLVWERRGESQRLRAEGRRWTATWRETAREALAAPMPPWRIDDVPECDDAALP